MTKEIRESINLPESAKENLSYEFTKAIDSVEKNEIMEQIGCSTLIIYLKDGRSISIIYFNESLVPSNYFEIAYFDKQENIIPSNDGEDFRRFNNYNEVADFLNSLV